MRGNEVLAYSVLPTGASSKGAAERSMGEALTEASLTLNNIGSVVATGYGRISVPFAHKKVTEIICHARGAHFLFSNTRTVIDIGRQDSKVIRVGKDGKVLDFIMNEKCAAGTGRFLEVMARALEVDLESMGRLSAASRRKVVISSMCTVFAESEVVSLIAEGCAKEDIIRGLHEAIADRIGSMVQRVGLEGAVTMTGGVAKNSGVAACLQEKLGVKVNIPDEPQIVGALGAALVASE